METSYCIGCHDFTEHASGGTAMARCSRCRRYRTCGGCGATATEEHQCPGDRGVAVVWCGYCSYARRSNPRDDGTWYRCSYCADPIKCLNCHSYWIPGHTCETSGTVETPGVSFSEVQITIGPGVELQLATPGGYAPRVQALAPRLHVGPTYREPVERALLAMDRAVRAGSAQLGLDLLAQAEILATEAG